MIQRARAGAGPDRDALFGAIYDELRRVAGSIPRVGRAGETMQATALTHELWLEFARRFPDAPRVVGENRATFFRSVALAMRTILRDHHRKRLASKRGGERRRVDLDDASDAAGAERESLDFLELDGALDALEQHNPRWHNVVLHRFFGGRTIGETARILGIADSTVIADWKIARAWLRARARDRAGPSDRGTV